MAVVALAWLLLAGTYLALVGSFSPDEAAAALLCGGLAALWVRQIRSRGGRTLRLRATALAPLPVAFVKLPGQTLRVGACLWRAAWHGDVAGEDRAMSPHQVANCPASADDPASAGACALSVLAASLSPDAYVLRLEPERGRVLVHAFLPRSERGA